MTMTPTIAEADLPEGGRHPLRIGGWPILLCRSDGAIRAVIDRCSHQASPLAEGRVRRGMIMCPLHGARFELASGKCLGGGYGPLKTFDVAVTNGVIHVAVPADAPPPEWQPVGSA
jgi:anthranilate 1,2-dioxygenase ferredoxin component